MRIIAVWLSGVLCGYLFFVWYNYRDRGSHDEPESDDEMPW